MRRFGSTFGSSIIGALISSLGACTSTVDSIGYDNVVPESLLPITCPSDVPVNAYQTILGATNAETVCKAKLDSAFQALFYGDADTQRIFFPSSGADANCDYSDTDVETACIRDIYHGGDIRTEGLGLGMLVTVLLDHRDEFDKLWRYAVLHHEITKGGDAGFFASTCDRSSVSPYDKEPCLDPYGLEQFVMALLLANQRWEPEPTRPDYAADALRLFALLRAKVVSSGGIVGDVTNSFDSKTKLPYAEPDNGGAQYSRTSLVMPGYYDIWASVTGDSFFTDAAAAGREFLSIAAHPSTGLYPREAYFDGSPKEDRSEFSAESYRVDFNLAIDKLWGTPSSAQVGYEQKSAANMLAFFTEKGLTTYDASYSIDGKNVLITGHVGELEMANAALATIASTVSLAERQAFLQAAWNQPIPDGVYRYYKGIFYLLGNLIICGQYRVCP